MVLLLPSISFFYPAGERKYPAGNGKTARYVFLIFIASSCKCLIWDTITEINDSLEFSEQKVIAISKPDKRDIIDSLIV